MIRLTQEDFDTATYEEDEVVIKECKDCGEIIESTNSHSSLEYVDTCPECGSENLLNITAHEGMLLDCDCGISDMFDTVVRFDSGKVMCTRCYNSCKYEIIDEDEEREDTL